MVLPPLMANHLGVSNYSSGKKKFISWLMTCLPVRPTTVFMPGTISGIAMRCLFCASQHKGIFMNNKDILATQHPKQTGQGDDRQPSDYAVRERAISVQQSGRAHG